MALTAARLDRISASPTVAMRMVAARLAAEGRDILRVSSGEPDFDTPRHIRDAAHAAIEAGETRYTDTAGTPALRRAVAERFRQDSGLDYRPEETIVATGGKQVIFNALLATIDEGDEAIIPTPTWVSYPDIVKLAGGVPVTVECGPNRGFRLGAEQLEAAITPRTKWLILNNPGNPTGTAYSAEDLRPLTEVLLRHPQVWVLTDDIYDKLVYDGFRVATVLQAEPRLRERTVTMNGCSKSYAMTGWRIGYAGAPVPLVKAMDKLQGQSTSNPSSISQAAALAALSGPQDCVAQMRAAYQRRRDMVVPLLDAAPGLRCPMPEGAFYVFPDLRGCLGRTSAGGARIGTDSDFVTALLAEEGVATVPGSAFLAPGHFRLSYAADDAVLREACLRIGRFCAGLR
ncbi:pyridoxal phosphate-dependent aminotransferase [Roseomonas sp. NAR14]|uniref:Aminotransferase n=1 Tax=Roseomonas acroporae TaxID=2937791 RepID=A0A9X1YBV1_9PROT|nr:pyridoxal phosphate-dependent aminotransferase [Roseomonas acroporae]MCK8787909.1 pyridoxal phosphate-dependent aminotransferase [Roseomonas acroporae]